MLHRGGTMHKAVLALTCWLLTVAPVTAKTANSPENVLHAIDRVTFGPRPGDVDAVTKMGVDKFVKQQLNPDSIDEDPKIDEFVKNSPALTLSATQLYTQFGQPAVQAAKEQLQLGQSDDDKKQLNKIRGDLQRKAYDDVPDAKLMRAIESPRQLQEVMTDFWYNHFNVFFNKGQDQLWIGAYEQQAIRPMFWASFETWLVLRVIILPCCFIWTTGKIPPMVSTKEASLPGSMKIMHAS